MHGVRKKASRSVPVCAEKLGLQEGCFQAFDRKTFRIEEMLLFGRGPPPHKLKERRKCRPAFRVQPQHRDRLRGGEFRQKLRLLPGAVSR